MNQNQTTDKEDRVPLQSRIPKDLKHKLKHIALDQEKDLEILVTEILQESVTKYERGKRIPA